MKRAPFSWAGTSWSCSSWRLQVRPGDHLEAAVLDRGVGQVVRQEHDLRPRGAAERVVPLHPVLVPVEGRLPGILGQDDDSPGALEVAEAELLQHPARGRPLEQPPYHLVVAPLGDDVLPLVAELIGHDVVLHQPVRLVAQLLQEFIRQYIVDHAAAVAYHLPALRRGLFRCHHQALLPGSVSGAQNRHLQRRKPAGIFAASDPRKPPLDTGETRHALFPDRGRPARRRADARLHRQRLHQDRPLRARGGARGDRRQARPHARAGTEPRQQPAAPYPGVPARPQLPGGARGAEQPARTRLHRAPAPVLPQHGPLGRGPRGHRRGGRPALPPGFVHADVAAAAALPPLRPHHLLPPGDAGEARADARHPGVAVPQDGHRRGPRRGPPDGGAGRLPVDHPLRRHPRRRDQPVGPDAEHDQVHLPAPRRAEGSCLEVPGPPVEEPREPPGAVGSRGRLVAHVGLDVRQGGPLGQLPVRPRKRERQRRGPGRGPGRGPAHRRDAGRYPPGRRPGTARLRGGAGPGRAPERGAPGRARRGHLRAGRHRGARRCRSWFRDWKRPDAAAGSRGNRLPGEREPCR